jgi:hypothetical protein
MMSFPTIQEGPCYADAALLVTYVGGQVVTTTAGSSSSAASSKHAAMVCISAPAGRLVPSTPVCLILGGNMHRRGVKNPQLPGSRPGSPSPQ